MLYPTHNIHNLRHKYSAHAEEATLFTKKNDSNNSDKYNLTDMYLLPNYKCTRYLNEKSESGRQREKGEREREEQGHKYKYYNKEENSLK